MAALTADKPRLRLHVPLIVGEAKLGANKTVFGGSLLASLNATGWAEAAFVSTTIRVLGVVINGAVSTTAGVTMVGYEAGDFEFENSSAGDLIVQADMGADVFVVDDNTVAKTNGTSTRSVAGKLVGFSAAGKPIVRVGFGLGST